MYQLSEQETEQVCARLRRQGISSRRLEQDLLDHICCHMERQLEQGAGFEQAYAAALEAVCPNGASEIEFELFFLLNFHKQLAMKKIIFTTGFMAAFLLSTGLMFKTLHWSGAAIILFAGFTLAVLTVLLMLLHLSRFMRQQPPSFWFRTLTGLAAVLLISLGFICRTFHLPGANVLYGLGTLVLNFVFLPVLFVYCYKNGLVQKPAHEAVF